MYLETTVRKNMKVLKEAMAQEAGSSAISESTSEAEALRMKQMYAAVSALMDAFCDFMHQWDEMREDQLKIISQQRDIMDAIRYHRHTPTNTDKQGT